MTAALVALPASVAIVVGTAAIVIVCVGMILTVLAAILVPFEFVVLTTYRAARRLLWSRGAG